MNVFNVDDLTKESRAVIVNKRQHEIVEMTVDGYLTAIKTAQVLKGKPTEEEQVNALVETVHAAIPTLPKEEIRAIPIVKLTAISNFIRGEVPDELKEAVNAEPVEEGAEAKN